MTIVNNAMCSVPKRDIKIENGSILVTYKFEDISKVSLNEISDSVLFSIPGFGYCNEVGKPKLPMRVDSFVIPYGVDVNVTCLTKNVLSMQCNIMAVEDPDFDNQPGISTRKPKLSPAGQQIILQQEFN